MAASGLFGYFGYGMINLVEDIPTVEQTEADFALWKNLARRQVLK